MEMWTSSLVSWRFIAHRYLKSLPSFNKLINYNRFKIGSLFWTPYLTSSQTKNSTQLKTMKYTPNSIFFQLFISFSACRLLFINFGSSLFSCGSWDFFTISTRSRQSSIFFAFSCTVFATRSSNWTFHCNSKRCKKRIKKKESN